MMKEKVRQSEYLLWESWVEWDLFIAELSLTAKPMVFSFHQAGMLLIWYSGKNTTVEGNFSSSLLSLYDFCKVVNFWVWFYNFDLKYFILTFETKI